MARIRIKRPTVHAAWAAFVGAVVGSVVGVLFAKSHRNIKRNDIVRIAEGLRRKR